MRVGRGGLRSLIALAVLAGGVGLSASTSGAEHKGHAEKQSSKAPVLPPPSAPAAPARPPETKAYDPQLMKLAEILGALTYLRNVCGNPDAAVWRAKMEALLAAEGTPATRKDRLAGAYNRGLEGYSLSYRTCTANAHLVIDRFLAEGEQIAKEVENRYRDN